MRYVVKVVYREDVVEGSNEPPPFSEWYSFSEDEYDLMIYCMCMYLDRRYQDCDTHAEKRALEVQHRGVLHVYDVPHFMALLPDRSVVIVFKVEVVF